MEAAAAAAADPSPPPPSLPLPAVAMRFPNWVMLEPFVLRRDDDDSFPDDTKAPIRAYGTTSWGARFSFAFCFAEAPNISRLYAQLPEPGFLDPKKYTPLAILATHRHLALFRVANKLPTRLLVQDFFIYNSAAGEDPSSSLKMLPPCTEPPFDFNRRDCLLPRRPPPPQGEEPRRLLTVDSMGLLSQGEEEFVVAELTVYKPHNSKVFADICLLHSSCTSADNSPARDQQLGGKWNSMRVPIIHSNNPDDVWQLRCWQTDAVIPFHHWLCWIDYYRGILFCDVSQEPIPTVSFLRLPLEKFPTNNIRTNTRSYLYRCASVVVDHEDGRALKFISVDRDDGIPFGSLKPGTGFTITCHTLMFGGSNMEWKEDYKVTSDQLWEANLPEHLPRDILNYPQVDIERPHIVHFLCIEFQYANKKMWVASIDMSTKIVESFSLYINGKEGLQTDDADLIKDKSMAPMPFLPCEFTKFLHR